MAAIASAKRALSLGTRRQAPVDEDQVSAWPIGVGGPQVPFWQDLQSRLKKTGSNGIWHKGLDCHPGWDKPAKDSVLQGSKTLILSFARTAMI
jgi:hypothetical protein